MTERCSGYEMAGYTARADANASPTDKDALPLLERALALIDELGLPANVGARLQEVIEALKAN
jgi:hypothetical protein